MKVSLANAILMSEPEDCVRMVRGGDIFEGNGYNVSLHCLVLKNDTEKTS